MREIRNSIRKRLKTKERRDTSAHGRLIDEYRPSKKADHHQEIYDKPTKKVRLLSNKSMKAENFTASREKLVHEIDALE
ncbi:unnamed protein product [Cylicostephanus goldi]|uniref:Uncharacterized protein n=1 Tax=Cylicostephanus goldi TaxID=71465 RepID=A0A3P6R5H1_CYLGO|nr:unnamed protein product [Cylicostephanus goldi]